MPDLVVVVPSRGRPEAAAELAQVFEETCTADTKLLIAVDDDDPLWDGYVSSQPQYRDTSLRRYSVKSMVESLNCAANVVSSAEKYLAIAFMGDDHRPRTYGWDAAYLDALDELGTGLVYGNDLLQGERLPTQVAMTSDIVWALGYMAPPELTHLFVDNFWLSLGKTADCIRYLPDVVVEHMHPVAKKAAWDEGYNRVNTSAMYERDRDAFEAYARDRFEADVAKVKALRAARV